MSNRMTKKSTRAWIFFLTTLAGGLFPVRTACAHDAPALAPIRLDFDAASAPKNCNDQDEFSRLITNWVPENAIRSDATRRLKVRIRRSPTGGKLFDVTLEDAEGTVLGEHHDRASAKTECHRVLYVTAYAAAVLLGAFEKPPAPEPVTCPVCRPPPAPAKPPAPPVPVTNPAPPKLTRPTFRRAAIPSLLNRRAFLGVGVILGTGDTPQGAIGFQGLFGYLLSANTPRIQLEFGGAWVPQSLPAPHSPRVLPVQTVPAFGSMCYSRYVFRICSGLTTTFLQAEHQDHAPGHDELRFTLAAHARMATEFDVVGPFSMRIDAVASMRFWQRTFGAALATLASQNPFGAGVVAMAVWSFE